MREIKQIFEKEKYKKMIVGTTENNIPFYVKCGFDKYYKTVKNFLLTIIKNQFGMEIYNV